MIIGGSVTKGKILPQAKVEVIRDKRIERDKINPYFGYIKYFRNGSNSGTGANKELAFCL